MAFQENRANQVVCTGISQIVLGFCVFALSFVLSNRSDDLGKIFETGVTYWGAVPVSIVETQAALEEELEHRFPPIYCKKFFFKPDKFRLEARRNHMKKHKVHFYTWIFSQK